MITSNDATNSTLQPITWWGTTAPPLYKWLYWWQMQTLAPLELFCRKMVIVSFAIWLAEVPQRISRTDITHLSKGWKYHVGCSTDEGDVLSCSQGKSDSHFGKEKEASHVRICWAANAKLIFRPYLTVCVWRRFQRLDTFYPKRLVKGLFQ
jgi:hypothetical protein